MIICFIELATKRLHKVFNDNESAVVKYIAVLAEQVSHEDALVQIRFLVVCVGTITIDNFI